MKQQTILGFAVFALLVLNISSVVYTQIKVSEITNQNTPTALASLAYGTTSFCINKPPSNIGNGTCNFTIPWGIPYQCVVNATDPENNSIYFQGYFTTPTQLFNVDFYGVINVTINESAIGNHTLKIIAEDQSGCGNNIYEKDFNIEVIDVNHAPYLSTIISNGTVRYDTTFVFSLDDYFTDIDGDNLTYIVSQDDNLTLVSIASGSGLTTIRGLNCGNSYFYFIATDPEGLTATSNTVKYIVTDCPDDSGSSSSSGGGGGGGGGNYFECISDWRCSKWTACQENGTRQLRCIDYNGCNPNRYIQFFTENCTFISPEYVCEEKWECSEWSTCLDEVHTRKCLDKNSCGTTNKKPTENESCEPIASCFNGIRDGDETDIDCGGSCGACKIIEQPTTISKFDSRIIIAGAIVIATVTLLGFAFRKKLKELLDKLLAYGKKKKQPIYLTEIQKQKLLNLLFKIQDYIDDDKQINLHQSINQLIQLYFMELLKINVPSYEEIHTSIHKINNKQLEGMLIDFYKRMTNLKKMNRVKTQETIDEIFDHIYLVSEFHDKDALILVKEREVDAENPIDKFYQKLSNLHIALEFKELVEAKNLYKELLEDYNKLSHEQKLEVYDDMMIVYNITLYLERFY